MLCISVSPQQETNAILKNLTEEKLIKQLFTELLEGKEKQKGNERQEESSNREVKRKKGCAEWEYRMLPRVVTVTVSL